MNLPLEGAKYTLNRGGNAKKPEFENEEKKNAELPSDTLWLHWECWIGRVAKMSKKKE